MFKEKGRGLGGNLRFPSSSNVLTIWLNNIKIFVLGKPYEILLNFIWFFGVLFIK